MDAHISSLIRVKNGAPPSSYTTATVVTSIGAMVIESLTIVSAIYLLIPLASQGQLSKLRGKLLIALVISDLLLGLSGAVSTAAFLAGYPLLANTATCDAHGFILTTVLFTQHLWTLTLAVVTFFLLKYPIHFFTRTLDRYWWWIPVGIWGFSALQSGVWYRYFGFVPFNGGSLCYYGPGTHVYDRDVMQFVPRAFVFVAIILLYSRLFTFLRRPDTIHISSLDWSSAELQSGLQSQIGTPKEGGGNSGWASVANEDGGASRRPSQAVLQLLHLGQVRSGQDDDGVKHAHQQQHSQTASQLAPWEKLEFEDAAAEAVEGKGEPQPQQQQQRRDRIDVPEIRATSPATLSNPFAPDYQFGARPAGTEAATAGRACGDDDGDVDDVDPLSSRPCRWAPSASIVPTLDREPAPAPSSSAAPFHAHASTTLPFPLTLTPATAGSSSFRSSSLDRRKSSVTFAAPPAEISHRLGASTSTAATMGTMTPLHGGSGSHHDPNDGSSAGASSSSATYVNDRDADDTSSSGSNDDDDDGDDAKGETLAEFFASTRIMPASSTSPHDDAAAAWGTRSRASGAATTTAAGGGGGGRRKSSGGATQGHHRHRQSRKGSLRRLLSFGSRRSSPHDMDDHSWAPSGSPFGSQPPASAYDDDVPRRSAASYFNRQAALLMLYFPLAYLVVFAFSLVRLIYDMATYKPSAALSALSLWFVLSAGLMDALVYGIAEYNVKRRVRRKMPEAFEPPPTG